MRIMTEEMHQFVLSQAEGLSNTALTELVNAHFGSSLTLNQIKAYKKNHRISSGLDGRFKKGQAAHNKNVKMSKDMYDKASATMFKKGHMPANHKPVGSERIDNKDGYIHVKTKEPGTWQLKHRFLWEQHYGPIPKGKCLIFLNGDKTDIRLENLMLIDRKVNVRLNQSGLRFEDENRTRTAVGVGELMSALGDVKRKRRGK